MRVYILIWISLTAILGYEYYALSLRPESSFLLYLQSSGIIDRSAKISTGPGGTLSLWLGWIGFGAMIAMNVYSLRKRVGAMGSWGDLRLWLNFHVFCGLVGPTLILFHSELKVRGIVGIAFWSMMVSFGSGIVGRYFYMQLLRRKVDYDKISERWLGKLRESLKLAKAREDEALYEATLRAARRFAGCGGEDQDPGLLTTLFCSVVGDFRLLFWDPAIPSGWPPVSRYILAEYATNLRRGRALVHFQKLMGLWHAFHFPFAVFMYLAAVIHVISSLIFLRAS